MLWVGTRPSARAAPASRQPPTSTRPARSSAGAHDAQSTYGSSGWGAWPWRYARERARVACGRASRGRERVLVRALAQHVEQVAIGRLRPVPERAAEVVQQHDRAALAERRGIAPEPHRVPETGGGRGDRVRRLARLVQRQPRERHDDRVELLGERDPAERDAAQQRLGVRRRPAARRGRPPPSAPARAAAAPRCGSGRAAR